jgi:antitoxin ParD1/3/4
MIESEFRSQNSKRLLEKREIKLAALQRALTDGENSGFANYSLSGLLAELDRE